MTLQVKQKKSVDVTNTPEVTVAPTQLPEVTELPNSEPQATEDASLWKNYIVRMLELKHYSCRIV